MPDIVTLGKPLGNRYPLAGVVARADIVEHFRREVMYFNTLGATPVACAAGSAVLRVIEQESLIENAMETGMNLRRQLSAIAAKFSCIGGIRGNGLSVGVELVNHQDSAIPYAGMAKRLVESMRDAGVLISKIGKFDNVLKIRPPLPFSSEDATLLAGTMDQVLSELTLGT